MAFFVRRYTVKGCRSHQGSPPLLQLFLPPVSLASGLESSVLEPRAPVICDRERGQALVIPPPSSCALSFRESLIYSGLLGGIR